MDIEERAKAMGYVSKEDFRGDPEKWIPAEEFVKRADNMMPIMKENLDRALGKIDGLEKTIKANQDTFKKFQEFSTKAEERAYKKAQAEHKNTVQALKAQLKAAAKAEDWDAYDNVERRIDGLEPPEEPPKPAETTQETQQQSTTDPPAFIEWKSKEAPWYGDDFELTALADSMGDFVKRTKPHLLQNLPEFYREVERQVKSARPDKFENDNQRRAPSVEGGSDRPTNTKKRTFADLPPKAKKEYEGFKSIMPDYKKEDYAKLYWEEEG